MDAKKKRLVLGALAQILCLSNVAFAENTRSFFYGDEAAMTGGAGVAVSQDSGALWYNPAGLGGNVPGRLELTSAAYRAKFRTVHGFLTAELLNGIYSDDATANDMGAIPTSAVLIRNVTNVFSWGLGLFQTSDKWMSFRSNLEAPLGVGDATWYAGAEYHQRAYTYHVAAGCGWQLHPRFRIGAALFLVYDSFTASYEAFAALIYADQSTEEDLSYTSSQNVYEVDTGAMVSVGVQWEFVQNWHAAIVVRSPTFKIWSWGDSSTVENGRISTANGTESVFVHDISEFNTWQFTRAIPMEAQVGLAYKNRLWWLGAEAALRPPMRDRGQQLLWNASIGGRYYFSERLNCGLGLFTDNSPERKPINPVRQKLDRYGATVGTQFKIPFTARGKKRSGKLIWAISAAIIYSFEVGEVSTIHMNPLLYNGLVLQDQQVVFHQAMLHLGTSLYF